eukprot:CAMPEP_0202465942 /NCGR_PEP_ID=MMETSP1360-20130828/67149_1 /ASSEMBLY_ACC=CAM_ASM_000848 /TAXON_ID=515479 /ORGANISM="Licmophora paradoxa, Strain CCMP2313" /LENGTH=166 /DNA_ID=CAMNT_0049089899 /DNA_START=14 /DNA_END=517 /DNA_ORIENTATION=-
MKLWVVRQEHMKEDIDTIDRAMGGDGTDLHMEHFDHVRPDANKTSAEQLEERKSHLSKHMSHGGLRNLCRVLCNEIQIYKQLMRRAEQNFLQDPDGRPHNDFAKNTIAELEVKCPREVQTNKACDPVIPSNLKAANEAATADIAAQNAHMKLRVKYAKHQMEQSQK